MAEDIVACSGCGKKFRIPDGSPPSGKFACTACGADVAWGGGGGAKGGGTAKAAARGGRKPTNVKGGRASARAEKDGGSQSRGARRAKGRKSREEPAQDEGGGGRRGGVPKEKENKTLPLVIALMGAVLLIGGLILAFTGDPPDYDAQAAAAPPVSTTTPDAPGGLHSDGASDASSSSAANAGAGTQTPTAPIVPLAPDMGEGEEDESGIGGAQATAAQAQDYRYWFLRPKDELFTEVPMIEGTTDEEAAHLRELAAKATDFYSGAQGVSAERELSKAGRKAMPFLISQFEKAWKGKKWEDTDEQFACSKIQQLSREITKADGPPSDLFVRFPPGPTVKPGDYERAARMWTAWWRGEGQHIEKFKSYEDEE